MTSLAVRFKDARRRGTFQRVSARQLWVGSCEMVAIVPRDSALHRAVGDARPAGSLREQRLAELRAVLGGAALGALLQLFAVAIRWHALPVGSVPSPPKMDSSGGWHASA